MSKAKIIQGDVKVLIFAEPKLLELHIEQGGTDDEPEKDYVLQIDRKAKTMTIGGGGNYHISLTDTILSVVKQFINRLDE